MVSSGAEQALVDCPACGQRGRKVKPVTLSSLAAAETTDAAYRFCATAGCDVAWFGEAGHRIPVSASRVAIGQKSTAPDRTLCYCFGHTAQDIEDEVAATGASTIPKRIADACKRGEDRCPETNPQGSCCLGNVHAALKLATKPSCCAG